MDALPERKPKYAPEIAVVIGYLVFGLMAIFLCAMALYAVYSSPPIAQNAFATALPPLRATPHMMATPAMSEPGILVDDFSDNSNNWAGRFSSSSVKVKDGKLALRAVKSDTWAAASCGFCLNINQPYYIQADFSSEAATDMMFGIMIGLHKPNNDSYLFGINTESREYVLYDHVARIWSLRVAGRTERIRSFPAVNTLGVYVNGRRMELYINGQIVDSYQESGASFEDGTVGLFVDDSGPNLLIDNLMLEKAGGQ